MPVVAVVEDLSQKAKRRAVERFFDFGGKPKEFAALDSYYRRRERQVRMAGFLRDLGADFLITINSNDPYFDHGRGRVALCRLDALLDRYFLGKRWCQFNLEAHVVCCDS